METQLDDYPVHFAVDYPDGPRNRPTVLFRLVLAIPIVIVLSLIGDEAFNVGGGTVDNARFTAGFGGVLFVPTVLMLLFRRKYPDWWFNWNLNLVRFENRVFAYSCSCGTRARALRRIGTENRSKDRTIHASMALRT